MKIALLGDTLFHQGAEYVLAILARGFVQHGFDVDVILSHRQCELQCMHPDWKAYELPKNCKVLIGGYSRGRHSIIGLYKLLRRNKYDLVMCHASPYSIPLVLASSMLTRRPKIVHVEHSPYVGVTANGEVFGPDTRMSFSSRIKNKLMSRFDAQFSVSTGTADAISRITGYRRDKIYVVYNPVIDDVFLTKHKEAPEHPWLRDHGDPVFVSAGAFQPYKNHTMLIRAFSKLVETHKARLLIFGDGPLRRAYERLIDELKLQDRVSLPGFTNNLPAAIHNAAGYIISSTVESFSIVCIEALACGTPVVSTNCPYGPPELLKGGAYGIIVDNDNEKAMTEGLKQVLDGKGIMPTPEMVAPFTIDATISRYIDAIKDVFG